MRRRRLDAPSLNSCDKVPTGPIPNRPTVVAKGHCHVDDAHHERAVITVRRVCPTERWPWSNLCRDGGAGGESGILAALDGLMGISLYGSVRDHRQRVLQRFDTRCRCQHHVGRVLGGLLRHDHKWCSMVEAMVNAGIRRGADCLDGGASVETWQGRANFGLKSCEPDPVSGADVQGTSRRFRIPSRTAGPSWNPSANSSSNSQVLDRVRGLEGVILQG